MLLGESSHSVLQSVDDGRCGLQLLSVRPYPVFHFSLIITIETFRFWAKQCNLINVISLLSILLSLLLTSTSIAASKWTLVSSTKIFKFIHFATHTENK